MGINIKVTTEVKDAASFIARSVLNQLKLNKHVLFFVTGGSSIYVGVEVLKFLKGESLDNLVIMLTDERYGSINHKDSNWYQLTQKGFSGEGSVLIPILIGEEKDETVEKFNKVLSQELEKAEYKIGLFGVGKDGHTAGILPESIAVNSKDFACSYEAPSFSRITITPIVIEKLDEAVVWVQGEDKWEVIKNLGKDVDIIKQPAQILKKVPLLTIFTDYNK